MQQSVIKQTLAASRPRHRHSSASIARIHAHYPRGRTTTPVGWSRCFFSPPTACQRHQPSSSLALTPKNPRLYPLTRRSTILNSFTKSLWHNAYLFTVLRLSEHSVTPKFCTRFFSARFLFFSHSSPCRKNDFSSIFIGDTVVCVLAGA